MLRFSKSAFEKGQMMLAVGQSAPDFVAEAHTGSPIRLSDYRGKIVLLWFFPKAATPG